MAIITESKKVAVNLKLENGQTEEGKVKTVNVALGTLNVNAFDAEKAYAIAEVLTPCLSKELYSIEKVETSEIYSN